jgi:hypothetical protein
MTPKCTGSMQVDAFVGICLPARTPVPAWSTSYGLIRSLSANRRDSSQCCHAVSSSRTGT